MEWPALPGTWVHVIARGLDRRRGYLAESCSRSADWPFKGDQDTFDAARPDAALDFNGSDRLELPALGSVLIEHILELLAGHLAAEHALAELDHRVLVSIRHAEDDTGAGSRDAISGPYPQTEPLTLPGSRLTRQP